jgi:hypothetical protein
VLAELAGAITRRGSYRGSREELTPIAGDLRAAVPLVLAAVVTLARPSAWTWFSSGSVSNYALSPGGWREILAVARQAPVGVTVAPAAERPARRPNHMPSPSETPLA